MHKINFLLKKMTPKLVVLQSCKKLQVLKRKKIKKRFFQLICTDKIFKTVCGNFVKINGYRGDIQLSVIFGSENCPSP